MILAFDTSSAACTAALFDEDGICLDARDEVIGRGHSERLVPLIDELLAGRRPDRLLVGVGPGSFTGIRVGIAAAQGLAIGWDAQLKGMSSLALIAAGEDAGRAVAVATTGGHGELFVQQFDDGEAGPLLNLAPDRAAREITADLVIGSGAAALVGERGFGEARERLPSARDALRIAAPLRTLDPKPVYVRAPDAKAMSVA